MKREKEHDDRYKFDFITYYRKDLDWLAFVTILFNVNAGLIFIDDYVIFADCPDAKHPLRHCTYILLANHLLQLIFLRSFYDEHRRVNTKNKWVWGIHLPSYCYIAYVYFISDAFDNETSVNTKIWIPLDLILTVNITVY